MPFNISFESDIKAILISLLDMGFQIHEIAKTVP